MYLKFFSILFYIFLPILGDDSEPFVESRIVGGSPTSIEKAPYMAYFRPNETFACDGFIVNKNQIVTAAHCVKSVEIHNPIIKVGSTFRSSFTQTFGVAKSLYHPNYTTYDSDVAVVTINGTFEFSQSVAPITLADKDFNLPEGALVKITGWGVTEKGNVSDELREVTVPVVALSTCIKKYTNTIFDITENMVCAGSAGKDSCQGDSGGPMTYQGKAVGIVSFGEKCGLEQYPGVYTRVSTMRPWLDTVLNFE